VIEVEHGVDRLPLFRHHDRVAAGAYVLAQVLVHEQRWQRARVVRHLELLTVVHAVVVMLAQPLAPAVQVQPPARLAARRFGIADEPQVRVVTCAGQGLTNACDPRLEPADPRVGIRPLEGQHVELDAVRNAEQRQRRVGRFVGLGQGALARPFEVADRERPCTVAALLGKRRFDLQRARSTHQIKCFSRHDGTHPSDQKCRAGK
jgi:hypothetical protein